MNTIKKIIFLLPLCLCCRNLMAQINKPGCSDSSFHIRYHSVTDSFAAYKQILSKDGGRIIIGKCYGNPTNSRVLVAKFAKDQQVLWCKKITPALSYTNLILYAVEEAGNGNIAVAGILHENANTRHFYYAILSPAGNIIKQEVPQFNEANSNIKGVHAICRLSADSLLFLFYSNGFVPGKEGLCMFSSDNAGNSGFAQILGIPLTNSYVSFSAASVSNNRLNLYGSGNSYNGCSDLNWSGTFTSVQFDLIAKQVIYHKTYCVPYTSYTSDYLPPPNITDGISSLTRRMFFLKNGQVAMVRPYKGYSTTTAYTAIPMFISYFDQSFTLLRSEFLQSRLFFKTPTIQDIFIDSIGTKHFSFSDFNNKAVYYAVADSSNNFLLQKKLPIPDFSNAVADHCLQVIQPGMFTGFTTQYTRANQTFLHYIQLGKEDTAAACFGSDTSFLAFIPEPVTPDIPSSPITTHPATMVFTPVNFPVTDMELVKEELCMIKNICDTLAVHAPDTVCDIGMPVSITVYKNPLCNQRIRFLFDSTAVTSFLQPNDTTLLLTFSKSWQGTVKAMPASCTQLLDSVNLVVKAPQTSFTIGNDTVYCPGHSYTLKAPAGFDQYRWQDGSTGSAFTATNPGIYYITATDHCNRTYRDTITIKPADFLLSAGADTTICQSENVVLKASPGFTKYTWSPSYRISAISDASATVFPDITTAYSVRAEKFAGCFISDTVLVTVKNCPQYFYMPNVFTPNDDRKNDIFKPFISGVLKEYELIIYNRWGQPVFRTTNRELGWNGMLPGKKAANGVYAWACKYRFFNQQAQIRKGTVVLLR